MLRELVVLAYVDKFRAAEVLAVLRRTRMGSNISLDDAVCIVRNTDWTVTLQQSVDLSQQHLRSTAFWRELVASVVPAPRLFDCRTNAERFGLTPGFKRQLGAELPPGSSAVLLLISSCVLDHYAAELYRFGGRLLHAPLSVGTYGEA